MTGAATADGELTLTVEGSVAQILIGRASRRNAFTQAMWEALPALLAQASGDPAVRVLLVKSAVPGAFSAGADISELARAARDPEWAAHNRAAIRAAQQALVQALIPTIAVVEGACVGGGCALAMACDMRVAAPAARFGIPAAKLALTYSLHDTKLLVDLVGPSQAKRLLLTGTLIDAAEAARIGLVDILTEDAGAAAVELARQIAAVSPRSVALMKGMVRRITGGQADDDADTLAEFSACFESPEHAAAVSAFLSRKPIPG